MSAAVVLELPWQKIQRNAFRAVTKGGLILTVSRALDGTWGADVDYPGVPAESSRSHRTRLIAQDWAERTVARRQTGGAA